MTLFGGNLLKLKRNQVKFNDDIYISGNIGDSYLGLKFLKKKIKKFSLY